METVVGLTKKTVLGNDFSKYTCLCVLLQPKVRIFAGTHTQRQPFQITEKSLEIILENSYSGMNLRK